MTSDTTHLAHLAITLAFAVTAIAAILMLAHELARDILPYTKGTEPMRHLPPYQDQTPPAHPAWGWLGATIAVVVLGGAMMLEALAS